MESRWCWSPSTGSVDKPRNQNQSKEPVAFTPLPPARLSGVPAGASPTASPG